MVKKGSILDGFDSIRLVSLENPQIGVGAGMSTVDFELELYDKNLILTNKWDKLPVLEKLDADYTMEPTIGAILAGTGQTMVFATIYVWNCELNDIKDDNLIALGTMVIAISGTTIICLSKDFRTIDYNIPLRNKITCRMMTQLPANAAGAAFTTARIVARLFFNIDYVTYSAEQLKDWILTEMFIDQ